MPTSVELLRASRAHNPPSRVQYLFKPDNFNKWIVASGAFNHGPVREFENHPIWASDPKLKMLPQEGEFGHPRGWPYHPTPEVERIRVVPQ
jgi:hypothetical protein